MARNILHLDASARSEGSVTRELSRRLVDRLSGGDALVIRRDVGRSSLPVLTEAWVAANFTPADARTPEQRETLQLSDTLIAEVRGADTLVLGVPTYNFGVPAAFKAWIDLIARARETFKYTETGAVGLLDNKKAYVVIASGGTQSGSAIDFVTPYISHMLGFLGIRDVTFIAADQLMMTGEEKIDSAQTEIDAIAV